MPNVRDSSGTIGTMRGPICLSRRSAASTRTNAIVVEISRSPVSSSWPLKVSSGGTSSGAARRRRAGSEPPSAARHSRRYCISGLSAGGLQYSAERTCASVSGSSNRSRKVSSAASVIFLAWWVIIWPSPETPIP